jgi:cell division protein FtsL
MKDKKKYDMFTHVEKVQRVVFLVAIIVVALDVFWWRP